MNTIHKITFKLDKYLYLLYCDGEMIRGWGVKFAALFQNYYTAWYKDPVTEMLRYKIFDGNDSIEYAKHFVASKYGEYMKVKEEEKGKKTIIDITDSW